MGKDKFLGGLIKGKSDPYGVLRLGTELFQSKVIHETVNPKWNEVYEVGLRLYVILRHESKCECQHEELLAVL